MKKGKKSLVIAISLILITFPVFGCKYCYYQGYRGKYPELYTETIYSVLECSGFYDSPSLADPAIVILESDTYGRIMYCYYESNMLAICIMQESDDNYVYYYSDYNFILVPNFKPGLGTLEEVIYKAYTEKEINDFKAINDFGKEFDESKCIKRKITLKKDEPQLSKSNEQLLTNLCIAYAKESGCLGKDSVYRYARFNTYDDYGRMLYYVYGVHCDVNGEGHSPTSESKEFHLAIIFNPDWSYDETNTFLELKDNNYQSDLKAFKELHNWNKPL